MLEKQLKSILKKKKVRWSTSAGRKKKTKMERVQKWNFDWQFNNQQL